MARRLSRVGFGCSTLNPALLGFMWWEIASTITTQSSNCPFISKPWLGSPPPSVHQTVAGIFGVFFFFINKKVESKVLFLLDVLFSVAFLYNLFCRLCRSRTLTLAAFPTHITCGIFVLKESTFLSHSAIVWGCALYPAAPEPGPLGMVIRLHYSVTSSLGLSGSYHANAALSSWSFTCAWFHSFYP